MQRYFLCIELHKLSNYIMKEIDRGANQNSKYPISGMNGWILRFIANRKRIGMDAYQKDLENEFGITRSTASKIVLLMEKKGYLASERSSNDARIKKLKITDKAYETHDGMREQTNNLEKQLLRNFSHAEIQTLTDFILRMEDNMRFSK